MNNFTDIAISVAFLILIVAAGVIVVYRLRRLAAIWDGRDVMTKFRPAGRDVAATERALGVAGANPVTFDDLVQAAIERRDNVRAS